MKHIKRNEWMWRSVVALGLLAVSSGPLNCAAAQSNELALASETPGSSAAAVSTEETNSAALLVTNTAPRNTAPATPARKRSRARQNGNNASSDMVVIGHSVTLAADKTANDMVVIGGSATALGKVRGDLVAILGDVMAGSEVAGDTVAVLGNVKVGTNAILHGDTVAVLGNIKLGANSKVHGDVVAVGGAVDRGEGAKIDGDVVGFPAFRWLGEWLEHCGFKLRPLAPQLGWLWAINGGILLLYLLIAIAFPRPVQACVNEITRRPATTVLLGLLTKILLPLVVLILLVTGIGVFVVPFLVVAVMVAGMFGKVGLLQCIGQQIGRQINLAAMQKPLAGFLVGWVFITLLYLVPVLGLIVFTLTGLWALGAVVVALFSSRRREIPDKPATPPPATPPPAHGPSVAMAAVASPPSGDVPPLVNPDPAPGGTAEAPGVSGAPSPGAPPNQQTAAAVAPAAPTGGTELLSYPKAGFWERMGAGFLDVVLVGILGAIVGGAPLGFLVALAYFAGLWAWKGTTVGGIVLKLQLVRTDGQPVSFLVALVRALAAAFSVVFLFLGFLWIAWDPDKQAWHDKIAGTIVVRLPRSVPLVCI